MLINRLNLSIFIVLLWVSQVGKGQNLSADELIQMLTKPEGQSIEMMEERGFLFQTKDADGYLKFKSEYQNLSDMVPRQAFAKLKQNESLVIVATDKGGFELCRLDLKGFEKGTIVEGNEQKKSYLYKNIVFVLTYNNLDEKYSLVLLKEHKYNTTPTKKGK